MTSADLNHHLTAELAAIASAGLTRRRRVLESPCGRIAAVDGKNLLNFASNDYLGLAGNPEIARAMADGAMQWGAGSGASHLVSGHLAPHEALEKEIAAFTGFPRALTFSTGYLANLAVTPTLAGRGDAVFADKLNGKQKPVAADFVGLTVPDRFVFGFGMDAGGAWRNMPAIYAMKEEA